MTATATTRYYSRDEVAEFETHEGDDRQQAWLSPYAIPGKLTVAGDADGLRIDIHYYGEEPGGELQPLGDAHSPPVSVRLGRYTRKVMEVRIPAPAVSPAGATELLRSVGDRFLALATPVRREHPAERLSLHLVGNLLRDAAPHLPAGARPISGGPLAS